MVGCSSKAEEHVNNGKDALINDDYEMAVEQFELALIEDVNNEEAQSLLEKAEMNLREIRDKEEEELNQQKRKIEFQQYADEISDIYFDYFDAAEETPFENFESQSELLTIALVNLPSNVPSEIFDQHQKFKKFLTLRRDAMNVLIANGQSSEFQQIVDESTIVKEEYFYEINKYLNENSIDPNEVGWPFY